MGAQVFLNCAGFIKIDTSSIGDNVEVLDGTRIHPETYEWARKMAVDALEYDEVCKSYEGNSFLSLDLYKCNCISNVLHDLFSFWICLHFLMLYYSRNVVHSMKMTAAILILVFLEYHQS